MRDGPRDAGRDRAPVRVAGLVLAAGRGVRYGGPKALARDADGVPWLERAHRALVGADVSDVTAVVPGGPPSALPLPSGMRAITAPARSSGLSTSLETGLRALDADVAVITLVDLPGLPAAAVLRLLEPPLGTATLRRAVYRGRPGHPVVVGHDHWAALLAGLSGDSGAGRYLREHGAEPIECSDLFDGDDIDRA